MKRHIQQILLQRLETERACALIGPRQVGKSYLLQEILKVHNGTYLSLDDPALREEIHNDPYGYLKSHYQPDGFFFIDEPAKAPVVFDALKILIDEQGNGASGICLANSGNYLLLRRIKESLAGRISLLTLLPLSFSELAGGDKNACGLIRLLEGDVRDLGVPERFDAVQIKRL